MAISETPRFGRRRLFQAAGGALATYAGAQWITATPSREPSVPKESTYMLYPGWIEQRVTEPFLQADRGHFRFVKQALEKNPILSDLTTQHFNYLLQNLKTGQRVKFGDDFQKAVDLAKGQIEVMKNQISPLANPAVEAVHMALYMVTASHFTWWNEDDLARLNIPIHPHTNPKDFFWDQRSGLARNVFPQLFKASDIEEKANDEVRNGGQDHAIHAFTHAGLAGIYAYSEMYGLDTHTLVPRAIQIVASTAQSPENRALRVSKISGLLYEINSTFSSRRNLPAINNDPPEGIFEPGVGLDLKANEIGARAGVTLLKRATNGQSLQPVFHELNDPKFENPNTEPVLTTSPF